MATVCRSNSPPEGGWNGTNYSELSIVIVISGYHERRNC